MLEYPRQPQRSTHTASTAKPAVSGMQYIERYKTIAIQEMNEYGIPASIKLAQALLESGNGNSYLAKEANNHFGIKCGGTWGGRSVTRPDDHISDCFRVYDAAEQSFKDHSDFLLRKRYERLFHLDKNDYKGWAHGLKAAGYATNPRYADLLIDLIERYELYQYDRPESFVQKEIREERIERKVKEIIPEKSSEIPKESIKSPVAMAIHEVKGGDTLYSISKLYNLALDELKELNGIKDGPLFTGQLLIVSKK